MDPKPADSATALEQLRGLLLAPERVQIQELRERVLYEPARAEDVAAVLPQAVSAGYSDSGRLVAALQGPVNDCIKASVRDDPQPLVDALFPIIGPAIRKSIAESLRSFTESLNRTIEYSFSLKGLRWRLEAARSGIPFGEVVLKHTLRYRVDEVFLIHRGTGLLIEHVAQDEVEGRDNDAVSGMLTAIQDFVQDAFRAQNRLQEVTLGEHQLWIIHGPEAMLACTVRGVPAASVRELLTEVLERAHRDYRSALADFSGDTAAFAGLKPLLRDCLVSEQIGAAPPPVEIDPAPKKSRTGWLMILLALAVGAAIGAWVWTARAERHRLDDYVNILRGRPGFVVDEVSRVDGHWLIRGLRDPLATDVPPEPSGLEAAQLSYAWTPYLSLDPVIVERRARAQLRAPASVGASVEDGVMVLTGSAPIGWIEAVRGTPFLPAGVARIDSSRVTPR